MKNLKVKFTTDGAKKRVPRLYVGDKVTIVNAKNTTYPVTKTAKYQGETYYELRGFGLVKESELEQV